MLDLKLSGGTVVDGRSIVQNQKLRRIASVGARFGSSQPCEPTAEWSST